MPALPSKLAALLRTAYAPCPAFTSACGSMRWDPTHGHVPRGFCGAAGELHEVELVLVGAEPGDPYTWEDYGSGDPTSQLETAYRNAYECFRSGPDRYHQNMRRLMGLCWPADSFDTHMRRVWITDSVLCSARVEGGPVSSMVAVECRARYLEAQLGLFPKAIVAALGGKAWKRLQGYPNVMKAYSVAPPGCDMHRGKAVQSWEAIARAVRQRAA